MAGTSVAALAMAVALRIAVLSDPDLLVVRMEDVVLKDRDVAETFVVLRGGHVVIRKDVVKLVTYAVVKGVAPKNFLFVVGPSCRDFLLIFVSVNLDKVVVRA